MKYAFLFLILIFFYSNSIYAGTIKSFNDSQALLTVAQFLGDNAPDMKISTRISDNKINIKDPSNCHPVGSAFVLKVARDAMVNVFNFYPDEELPVEEALNDLKEYIGSSELKMCLFSKNNSEMKISIVYFFDRQDKIHLKVDTITLRNP